LATNLFEIWQAVVARKT